MIPFAAKRTYHVLNHYKSLMNCIIGLLQLVEATDTTLESLIAEGALERLNEEIKSVADAVTSLTVPTFKQVRAFEIRSCTEVFEKFATCYMFVRTLCLQAHRIGYFFAIARIFKFYR